MSNKRVWGSQNLLSEPGVHPPLLPSRIRFSPTELFPSLLDPFFPPFHPSATGGAAWQQRASPPCTQAPPQTPNLMRAPGLLHSCPIWVKTNKQTNRKRGEKKRGGWLPPYLRAAPGARQRAAGMGRPLLPTFRAGCRGPALRHFPALGTSLCAAGLQPSQFFFSFFFFFYLSLALSIEPCVFRLPSGLS